MNDAPSPTDNAQLDKITEVLAALVDETRQSKVMISDVIAQRTQYAADIRDLKAAIDTTRRALDPEVLGEHVAANTQELMGQSIQAFAKGIQINHDAATANQNAAQNIAEHADTLKMERNALKAIATHLEERDQRSKWDWVTLGCAMLVAAALAGTGAYYFAKTNIEAQDFNRSVQLIAQDNDATWCGLADGRIVQDDRSSNYCAIRMLNYVANED